MRRKLTRTLITSILLLTYCVLPQQGLADSTDCYIGNGVAAGDSENLQRYRRPYGFKLPSKPGSQTHYRASDVVGMGVDGENNYNFVWFRDGRVSVGTSNDLSSRRTPYRYVLPRNPQTGNSYRPSDIVGMAVDGENNSVFAWYKNGYVSSGSSDNLGKYRSPYAYRLPVKPGTNQRYRPSDIIGMGIDGSNKYNFVFFDDGMVSAGTSKVLDSFRKPYRVRRRPASNVGPNDVIGMGIDGENNWIFVWFEGKDSRIC